MDKIGLVTITYNSADVLQPFLDCVLKQTYNNFIVYVIDNSSIDNTLSILKENNDSRLFLIANKINFGVAKANNQGILKAIEDGCDHILIINNDVEFEPALIEKLIKAQQQNNCSLVAPKMTYYDIPSKIWYAGSWFIKNKGYLPIHRGMEELDKGQYDETVEVEYAPTCCLLVKKEVFQDIGMMNEKYFVYFDDTDFLFRVKKSGNHKLYYDSKISLFHKVGSLTKSLIQNNSKNFHRSNFFLKQNIRNHVYFLRKNGDLFCYLFCLFLFLRNNLRFFISPRIKKDMSTFILINKSYFQGWLL